MVDPQSAPPAASPAPPPAGPVGERGATRRRFLSELGRKAGYIAPLVLLLSAPPARAAVSHCLPYGSPCTANADCCSNNCVGAPAGTCQP
jgi:hypothetical protein